MFMRLLFYRDLQIRKREISPGGISILTCACIINTLFLLAVNFQTLYLSLSMIFF